MLSAIAIVPSAPVMVPELAAGAAAETADLRAAAFSAVAALPPRWIGVGVAESDYFAATDSVGTFAGYGVDLPVGLSGQPLEARDDVRSTSRLPSRLPLCALITAWLRGVAHPGAVAEVRAYRSDREPDVGVALGRQLRAEIDATDEAIGVLIVAEGANTLSPAAPGGYDPDSIPTQAALDDALADGDPTALALLPDQIIGRFAFYVLAGLCEGTSPSANELYRRAPYGVGYFVGIWRS